jgi:hypothetical protein
VPRGVGDALRVLIDQAGQRGLTPDHPIADAMLQVVVPSADRSGTTQPGRARVGASSDLGGDRSPSGGLSPAG